MAERELADYSQQPVENTELVKKLEEKVSKNTLALIWILAEDSKRSNPLVQDGTSL